MSRYAIATSLPTIDIKDRIIEFQFLFLADSMGEEHYIRRASWVPTQLVVVSVFIFSEFEVASET